MKNLEITEEIQKVVDPLKSKTSSLLFAVDGSATLPDIRKKTEKSNNVKGYKIPKSSLTRKLVHKIEVASGMRDEDVEVEQEEEKTEHPDILSEHRMEDLRRHAEDLKEFDKAERSFRSPMCLALDQDQQVLLTKCLQESFPKL